MPLWLLIPMIVLASFVVGTFAGYWLCKIAHDPVRFGELHELDYDPGEFSRDSSRSF